jgi:hypothetical protein
MGTGTWSGYDGRTLGGYGNLVLVAGGIVHRPGNPDRTSFRITRLLMTLPEPSTTTSFAAGLIGLWAVNQWRQRRRRR